MRGRLVRIVVVALVATIVAFFFKDALFNAVLAPKECDFVTYRLFDSLTKHKTEFHIELINVEIAQQFLTHMKVAFWIGLLAVSPYVIYVLFGFVEPALYTSERRNVGLAVVSGYVMFMLGIALNYFIIFPLTFRFLGTYQVSGVVTNMISLDSYITMLLTMSLIMGAIFELPVLSWLLARIGILTSAPMRRYRRHAVVAILILAAVITPTSDVFTLTIVALPIYLLYELSILVVKLNDRSRQPHGDRP